MKHFPKAQLAIAMALAAGLTAGCNNNPERASTNERDDTEMVSMKSDADIQNRSADKASVLPRSDTGESGDEYSLQEDYPSLEDQQNRNQNPTPQQSRQVSSISEDNTVLFEFDSADLTDNAKESLDQIAEVLEGQGDAVESITIRGYADAAGPDAYNEQLSQSRAESVRNYLRDQGVNADSWEVEGRGEDDPVASNDDAQGRSENRRVVIELSGDNVEGLSSSYSPD
jgi:outer membrane protein OmpA-like peptidoglycan-associated protein